LLSAIDCLDSDDVSVLLLLSAGGFAARSGSTLPVIRSVLKESTSRTRDAR
jgi:hypothetical protein